MTILKVLAFSLFCLSCKNIGTDASQIAEANHADVSPVKIFQIGKPQRAGDQVEVPLDPNRRVVQATIKYSGNYSLYERDASGAIVKNDEGQPRYRDGMYAHGYIVDKANRAVRVAAAKFIDANETDNWHDLTPMAGKAFRIEFQHSPKYAKDAEVLKAKRAIFLESIKVQYEDSPDDRYQEIRYAQDDENEFAPDAKLLRPGEKLRVNVTAQKIYRIDVRWGDAKPRDKNGVYIPGLASGLLSVDGQPIDSYRNVAMIESQTWGDIPTGKGSAKRAIELQFSGDEARVFWIRVYSKD